jgi:peptidyl-prolyl cis-trans isomerase A (cyclophilin A)
MSDVDRDRPSAISTDSQLPWRRAAARPRHPRRRPGGRRDGRRGAPPSLLHPASLTAKAPETYSVAFTTTKGKFVVTVHRAWAPRGADRFYNLVRARFFDGVTFFRVVKGFVVQFGISPTPAVSAAWQNAVIKDDPVKTSNAIGTITYADAGPNTRTTQVFINLGNNASLDGQGFAPFGKVTSGMSVVDKLYGGYGDQPTGDQQQITQQGNAFLKKHFPKLDGIVTARLVSATH